MVLKEGRAFGAIARRLARVKPERAVQVFDRALAVTEGFQDNRSSVLRTIAEELAKVSVDKAARVAKRKKDPSDQANAFLGIAQAIWEKESDTSR